jgi:hypothetical protein
LILAGLAALLAGCEGSGSSSLPVACPRPSLPAELADLTRYREGAVQDLASIEFDARLTSVNGTCQAGRRNRTIEMEVIVGLTVDRGPAAQGRTVQLAWMLAVVDNTTEAILTQQRFRDNLTFNPNETRVTTNSEPVRVTLPVGETRRAQDYRVVAGFVLAPDELALNRRRGPR